MLILGLSVYNDETSENFHVYLLDFMKKLILYELVLLYGYTIHTV